MKQKEIFMAYLNNNRDRLEKDGVELMLAQERLYAFEEFAKNARSILKLSVPEPMTYVSIDVDYAKHRVQKERNKGKD